jgi:hypothetical protein
MLAPDDAADAYGNKIDQRRFNGIAKGGFPCTEFIITHRTIRMPMARITPIIPCSTLHS